MASVVSLNVKVYSPPNVRRAVAERVRKAMSREEYSPEEQGTWNIYGEDPNCDFGGHHSQPFLGTVTGTYKNVLEYAQTLAGWTTWGGGGRIQKISPTVDVDTLPKVNPRIAKLKEEKAQLQARLAEVERELAPAIKTKNKR